ncbi:hypothetical protein HY624_01535, partial [Candidatus Uhrbacteria bacterium]|nr:hypothetical protein [Candidatus Uhrbacteria bacterium]
MLSLFDGTDRTVQFYGNDGSLFGEIVLLPLPIVVIDGLEHLSGDDEWRFIGHTADGLLKVRGTFGTRKRRGEMELLCNVSGAELDSPFVLVTTFSVVVPADYDHATRLATFRRLHGSEFTHYNGDMTDEHFRNATVKLTPGRKFLVKVFQITSSMVSPEECLTLITREQGVLVGAQGATLAYEQGKDHLPKGRWHISFDEKEALWEDASGLHRVPLVGAYADGSFGFDLGIFVDGWDGDRCLLCFCE